jgi:uncharacterized protein (DUF305 family)
LGRYAKLWLPALLLAAVLILASCGGAGTGGNEQGGSDDNMQGMNHGGEQKTTGEMAGMDHDQMGHGGRASEMLTENGRYSDERFIDAMVPHHQGAVEMARVALKNAEHKEIKQLSRNIISTQQAEIEELKSIKKEQFGTSKVPMEMSPEQMQGMGMMMDPEQLAHEEPFDRAFIDAMIPHHQSAIEMAQVAYKESENPQIKNLARDIIDAQEREIAQMKEWRQEWYPEG